MSPSNERSAEFYRGALSVLEGRPCTAEYYRTLLAAAEAREGGEKREAWILSQNTEPRQHDWFHSGLSPHPCCRVCGIVQRRDGNNSPCKGPTAIATREAAQPTAAEVQKQNNLCLLAEWKQAEERLATAAEVIEACRVALVGVQPHIARIGHYPGSYEEEEAARSNVEATIALLARWKEANGGK